MNSLLAQTNGSVPAKADEKAVVARGLIARYPGEREAALQLQTLDLPAHCRVALIGSNGAGKSTLLRAIAGLLLPASGTIRVLDARAGACPQRVAYVPQSRDVDAQFPITAFEVAMMGRDCHLRWPRFPRARDREKVRQSLRALDIEDLANRRLGDLSGGQRQRVFLARALAQQGELLLLDEPFVGVDSATEAIIHRVIAELTSAGKSVIVATHDLVSLRENYDFVAVLAGRGARDSLVCSGAPAEVLRQLQTPQDALNGCGYAQQIADADCECAPGMPEFGRVNVGNGATTAP